MTQASAQAAAFYREVAEARSLWTIEDDVGYPAPMTSSGQRSQPFWSRRSRAERIIKNVAAYATFTPVEVSWENFCEVWVPGMTEDGLLVGVNWSGPDARGYDISPADLKRNVEAAIASLRG
jgi:Protein of unknown function (DUF2750)